MHDRKLGSHAPSTFVPVLRAFPQLYREDTSVRFGMKMGKRRTNVMLLRRGSNICNKGMQQ